MAEPEQVEHGWMRGKTFRLKVDCLRAEVYEGYWEGGEPKMKPTPYKKGDIVKVVMVSCLGDCGITTDLNRGSGYAARVYPEHLEAIKLEGNRFVSGTSSRCGLCYRMRLAERRLQRKMVL